MINTRNDNIAGVGSVWKLMGTSLETQKITDETIKLKFQIYIEKAVEEMRPYMNTETIHSVLDRAARDVNQISMPAFVARMFS